MVTKTGLPPVQFNTAVIWVELFTVYDTAATPPKLTALASQRLVPVIVTVPPPVPGVTEVMVGTAKL